MSGEIHKNINNNKTNIKNINIDNNSINYSNNYISQARLPFSKHSQNNATFLSTCYKNICSFCGCIMDAAHCTALRRICFLLAKSASFAAGACCIVFWLICCNLSLKQIASVCGYVRVCVFLCALMSLRLVAVWQCLVLAASKRR